MKQILVLLLILASFYGGSLWEKSKITKTDNSPNSLTLTKSNKPELKFFVMSFCPYGNQIEDIIKPVAELLGDKADIRPQYIFDKIDNLENYCQSRSADSTQCATYVDNIVKNNIPDAPFKTVAGCQQYIADLNKACLDEKSYIKTGNAYYTSLHGRIEANQDVREICAWNQTDDKKKWWDFISKTNQNCTSENADTCWEDQAKAANLDTGKITECFNKEAIDLIEKEIALTEKFKVQGSPTLLINDSDFPPESAYQQDGKGTMLINGKTVTQDKYRTPNTIKEAICSAFKKAPKECNTPLAENTTTTEASCN